MSTKDFSVMLLWRDEAPKGSFGPGVSRAREGERTKPFAVIVRQGNARPMKVTMPAPNKRAALRYASARWPGAVVEAA
jgi:hypothetical protein